MAVEDKKKIKQYESLDELNEELKPKHLRIENINAEDFEKVYPLLKTLDPKMPEKRWKNLFTYKWKGARDFFGFGLYHNSKLVGFIGTVFSQREHHKHSENICNLTSLIIKEDHRNQGLSKYLLAAVLSLKDTTVTGFSASERAYQLYKTLGFQEFETDRIKIPTYKNLLSKGKTPVEIKKVSNHNVGMLNEKEKEIYHDHKPYRSYHMIMNDGKDYCYLVFSIIFRNKRVTAYLNYISHPSVFNKYIRKFCKYLFLRHIALFLVIDKRLIHITSKLSFTEEQLPVPKIYKSERLKPKDIENIYSELILLDI